MLKKKLLKFLPIGIFDSGVGGLTVIKSLIKELPHENFIYLGDTARAPYGSRSANTIEKYTEEDINFLLKQSIKLIVCACNTASAVALPKIVSKIPVPVIGVIDPMIKVIKANRNLTIGILGTRATINSKAYQNKLKKALPSSKIFNIACPLLVPLIEEGWLNSSVTRAVIRQYLTPLLKQQLNILILGCTHYPLIRKQISKFLPETLILDSGTAVSKAVEQLLAAKDLLNPQKQKGKIKFFVTDSPAQFNQVSKVFLSDLSSARAKQVRL